MLIKDNSTKCDKIPPLKSENNSYSVSDEEIANTLNNYFVSISTIYDTNSNLPN
jgi:hypothetical protein